MSIDKWFVKRYDYHKYNCLHFASDVWMDLKGYPMNQKFFDLWRQQKVKGLGAHMQRIPALESPCIVLFTGGAETHVGVYFKGRVLHLCERGVQYLPLISVAASFRRVRFYRCNP